MISVADLLEDSRISGNYFDYDAYVKADLELGLLENRRGDRLIAIPDTLISALHEGIDKEIGQAGRLVLFNCGKWWGKNFYTRFSEEITEYYDVPLADMDMTTFLECLQECWVTHGWGRFEFDSTYRDRGFLILKTFNSPYKMSNKSRPTCHLEAGIFTSFFSRLTGRELFTVQISCESMGADCNRFVLGLTERLAVADALIEEGLDHEAIMERLLS